MKSKYLVLTMVCISLLSVTQLKAISPTGSCVNQSYKYAVKNYRQGHWVDAFGFLRATEMCILYSRFSSQRVKDQFLAEIRSARGEAWRKIHRKQGVSFTTPRLRDHPPR